VSSVFTRRSLLTVLSAAPLAPLAQGFSGTRIRLGGPVFIQSEDPEEIAREHRRLGYSAATCPKAKSDDKDRVRAIQQAFSKQDVLVAEVGAWVNMLDPDAAKRKANLEYVTERLALAEAVGARCCVDIAGSFHPTVWYGIYPRSLSKEAFDSTVQNCRQVIDAIKPTRTKFSIEMQVGLEPGDPDGYVKLVKAVDREAFGVHLDVCNTIDSPQLLYASATRIQECFQKLGRWVLSCHAKDLEPVYDGYNVHFAETIPGRGYVNYKTYLTELAKMPVETP
jgi:sugar phosphate isomerase/epimerase